MKQQEIEQLSLKQLKDLKSKIDSAISSFERRRKQEAREKLEAQARSMGFSLADLVGSTGRKRAPAVAKYANPSNRSETWSGRGRKPRWVQAALDAGKTMDDLAI